MNLIQLAIRDVIMVEPTVHGDERGYFMETWSSRRFAEAGIAATFVQDNHSHSTLGTIRGLHYQLCQTQGKLVRVVNGSVFDVAVDLRRRSETFGHWVGIKLSAENRRQLWIPPGFAHGFAVLSSEADFVYKVTDYYHSESERTLLWNDPEVAIDWPIAPGLKPILSTKDQSGQPLRTTECFE